MRNAAGKLINDPGRFAETGKVTKSRQDNENTRINISAAALDTEFSAGTDVNRSIVRHVDVTPAPVTADERML